MRTETINIYTFDELTEEAKQQAINDHRESQYSEPFFWSSEALQSIEKGLDAFSCSLGRYSIDWGNANGSHFPISCPDNAEELTGIRLRTWLINNADSGTLTEPKHYGKYIFTNGSKSGKYQRYSRILKEGSSCPFTGVCYDESFLDPVRKFIQKPDNSTLADLMEAACIAVNRDIESEIDYNNTDEAIIDTIKANEYEFTENGEIV